MEYNDDNNIKITSEVQDPQKIIFDGFKKIRYLYPHSNPEKDIEIYFRNYELAKFSINIIYDNGENEKNEYSSDKFIFIKQDKLKKYCKMNELCKIILDVELLDKIQTKKPIQPFL